MIRFSQFYALENSVEKHLANNEFNGALDDLANFVTSVMNEQYTPGELVGSRKLDALCGLVGNAFYERRQEAQKFKDTFIPDPNKVVIVCTGLFRYGGTSLLIGDIIRAQGNRKCVVLATNSLGTMTDDDLALSRLGDTDAKIISCPGGGLADRLEWLVRQITQLEPGRIFLLNHHQDAALVAGVRPFTSKTKVIFYHHADYNICLGVHLDGAIHVDPHNVGFCNCRENLNIRDNAYVPMTVDDKGADSVRRLFLKNGRLTTCSSGTYHKFQNFYLYSYHELVFDRLARRNGRHIHIGNIPDHDLGLIADKLKSRGIDQARFVHIPWAESLWHAMIENEVDLFIGSFPIGGARTYIEAMGAGVPMLMHENYLSRFHSSRDVAYPGALLWQYPDQFYEILEKVDGNTLRQHADMSRQHYLRYHCTERADLKGELDRICNGRPTAEVPPLYPYGPDLLDRVLHFTYLEKNAIATSVHNGVMDERHRAAIVEEQRRATAHARKWTFKKAIRQAAGGLFKRG